MFLLACAALARRIAGSGNTLIASQSRKPRAINWNDQHLTTQSTAFISNLFQPVWAAGGDAHFRPLPRIIGQ